MTPTDIAVRRRYLVLLALRWLPSGLIIPILVLLPLQRGLSLGELGLVSAIQGLTILCLEVPTGGLADTFGRRPVLLIASALNVGSLLLLSMASSLGAFAAYFLLQGVYRALDSGPLDSWYIDATLDLDPDASIERGLSLGNAVMSTAIGAGALLSGLLVAWAPIPGVAALATPVVVAIAVRAVEFAVMAVLLHEDRTRLTAAPGAAAGRTARLGATIRSAVRLVLRSKALLCLLAVEICWGFGTVSFETLTPVRLTDVMDDAQAAASLMGPLTAFAWLASAAGAALAIPATRRIGAPLTAAALRVLHGVTVAALALFGGVIGVATAFLACYLVHGASSPVHTAMLHRQVGAAQRTTVASLNSMVSQPSAALGLIGLTALAGATTVPTAMLVGAAVLALAAPLYLLVRAPAPRTPAGTPEAQPSGGPPP
jgi:MFS transporter, DHA1 family, tetracycline resistance protein